MKNQQLNKEGNKRWWISNCGHLLFQEQIIDCKRPFQLLFPFQHYIKKNHSHVQETANNYLFPI